ncbi:hypothetical protein JHK87_055351 [Glycine soja]|nr:hypothetical protein JHK87_055351 [Glycine soja]
MPSLHLLLGATTAPNSVFLLRPHSSLFPSKTLTLKKPKSKHLSIFQWNRKPELFGSTPHVTVITSGKGSVGRTTTHANIDLSFTRVDFSVIAIDADVGFHNLDLLLGLENHVNYTVIEVLNGDQGLVSDNNMSMKSGWQDLLQQHSMVDLGFCRLRRGSNNGSSETRMTGSGVAQKWLWEIL